MDGKLSRTLHVDFTAPSSSACDELPLGKTGKALQYIAGAVLHSIERQGFCDESRKPVVRNASLRRPIKRWRATPHFVAFCIVALVGLVPLLCYFLAWMASSESMHAPVAVLSFGLYSSINTIGDQPHSTFRPQLIPRLVHQTYKSAGSLPEKAEYLRRTWRDKNPGWKLKLWDDEECRAFVKREFPRFYTAYMGLPKDVERADFFRYLVVYRLGGVYADIDTECKVSLDTIIRPTDSMVVGWEAEVPNSEAALRRHFSRVRQIQQWMFAAVPGHPALEAVCEHINSNFDKQYSTFTNMDTLDRTGPGAWTDAVLQSALAHPPGQVDDPGRVRILPQVATGVHPKGSAGIDPLTRGIAVQHHFLGSWKKKGGWRRFGLVESTKRLLGWLPPEPAATLKVKELGVRHFPVSIAHSPTAPPFAVLVDLVGHGDVQSREEAGAILTKYGNWQAGTDPTMEPFAVSAVVGSLGEPAAQAVFVDIGAGIGYFSLYAASRGHHVVATELAPRSLAAFRASVAYNNFGALVSIANVTVGASAGLACTQPLAPDASLGQWRAEDVARGYAHRELHARTDPAACGATAKRVLYDSLVPAGAEVRAVRISAGAWTGDVLEGALPAFRRQPPRAVMIELDASEIARAGHASIVGTLQAMRDIGYTDMSHAGWVCSERWETVTREVRNKGRAAPVQPVWCNLTAEHLATVTQMNRRRGAAPAAPPSKLDDFSGGVEIIIMVHGGDSSPTAEAVSESAAVQRR